jgi:hypothetical protein
LLFCYKYYNYLEDNNMAYKFQLGEAKLSGSITQTDGTFIEAQSQLRIGSAQITETELGLIDGITAGTAEASKALVLNGSKDVSGINLMSMATLTASAGVSGSAIQGGAFIGANFNDGIGPSFTVTSVLNATGGISIEGVSLTAGAADLNVLTNVVDEVFDGANDKLIFSDANDSNNFKTFSRASLATSLASGTGIVQSNGQLAVDGVLEDLDALGAATQDGEFIVATGAGVFAYESGNTARTSLGLGTSNSPTFAGLTVNGDLTVTGSLTYVNTTNLAIADAQITIGSGSAAFANGYGLEFGAMDGGWAQLETATINSDNYLTSSLNFSAPIVYAPTSLGTDDWEINSTHISGNLPVYASAFHGDGSNLTGISADTATALTMAVVSKADGNSLEENKVNYFATLSANATVSLPASDGDLIGKSLYIKLGGLTNDAVVTVNTNGASQKIDGADSILLESAYAAVRLIYVASDDWRVF